MGISWQLVCALILCSAALAAEAELTPDQKRQLPPPADRKVVFAQDIKPLLETSCIQCHGHGRAKGGFQMDTRETFLNGGDSGPAVEPGKSTDSLLVALVSGLDPDDVMPRKGRRLTPSQVGLLRAWIDQGLPWDENVTFARPEPLNLRPVNPRPLLKAREAENPIDQILESYYATNSSFVPTAVDDRTFARRVYLDAIGLLPPPGELKSFLQDARPDKRALLVGSLLENNEAYAEHWLSFWNDLLRNDYRGTGYIDGGRKQITPWLFQALRTNLPYDRFVAQLIYPGPESEGFSKGIVWRGVVNASQTPAMQAAQNISQVFMGVNLKCASCHDSFINDWKLSDSYALACVYSEGPLELFQCDKPTGRLAEAGFLYPELGAIDPKANQADRVRRLAEIIIGPADGRLPRTIVNRYWERLFGRGLVEPVDDMDRPAWSQELLDWLAEDLVANHWDLKKTIALILTSRAYQLPAVNLGETADKSFVFRGPAVRRFSAEQFRDALAQLTGVWCGKSELSGATNRVRASLVAADPLATALGRPNREQVVTVRSAAATTLQGLELTNGETLADTLHAGAQLLSANSPVPSELVEQIYHEALGREPAPQEKDLALELVGSPVRTDGLEDFLWAVSMLPEFQLIY